MVGVTIVIERRNKKMPATKYGFHVGQKVMLCHNPGEEKWAPSCEGGFNDTMEGYCRQRRVVTIERFERDVVRFKEVSFVWDFRWFEPLEGEPPVKKLEHAVFDKHGVRVRFACDDMCNGLESLHRKLKEEKANE